MSKSADCPHCGASNTFDEPDPDEVFREGLPKTVTKSGLVVAASLLNPVLGILAGGVLLARNVARYIDGIAVTCAKCGQVFRI